MTTTTLTTPTQFRKMLDLNIGYAATDARNGSLIMLRGDLSRALGWANRLDDNGAKGKIMRAFGQLRTCERRRAADDAARTARCTAILACGRYAIARIAA